MSTHFNPRPPCGRRHGAFAWIAFCAVISTHVPRAGDDETPDIPYREGGRFQPTSPVRETTPGERAPRIAIHISTHVPRAGDDPLFLHRFSAAVVFQPTSPVRETTRTYPPIFRTAILFQPTSPVRETTLKYRVDTRYSPISTHVPRAGDDSLHPSKL